MYFGGGIAAWTKAVHRHDGEVAAAEALAD